MNEDVDYKINDYKTILPLRNTDESDWDNLQFNHQHIT